MVNALSVRCDSCYKAETCCQTRPLKAWLFCYFQDSESKKPTPGVFMRVSISTQQKPRKRIVPMGQLALGKTL